MSTLCDGFAVPLVRHFHPLHCRHVSDDRSEDVGGKAGGSVGREEGGGLPSVETMSRSRRIYARPVSVLLGESVRIKRLVQASCSLWTLTESRDKGQIQNAFLLPSSGGETLCFHSEDLYRGYFSSSQFWWLIESS